MSNQYANTSDNESFGLSAIEYAKSIILEGSTQLINNQYSIEKQAALKEAIDQLREAERSSKLFLNIDSTIRNWTLDCAIQNKDN